MKKKIALVLVMLCLLGAGGVAAFAIYRISSLDICIGELNYSVEAVSAFAEAEHDETFRNDSAYEMFEQEKTEKEESDEDILASYSSPEGILFKSYSKEWGEEKLLALYEELLKNKHGEEINSLIEVNVFAQEDYYALAYHQSDTEMGKLTVRFPAIPRSFKVEYARNIGIIALYGGDKNTTVESMARSLSHEYGHHYTKYYMLNGEEDLSESEYVKKRGLDDERVRYIRDSSSDYIDAHQWYLAEIAAEDYIALMGSPTVNRQVEILDVYQQLVNSTEQDYSKVFEGKNTYPQENLFLPYSGDIPGLAEYFYSFLGEEPASFTRKPIGISVRDNSSSYNVVTGLFTAVNYEITWDMPYEDALYTLLLLDSDEYLYPIKTVRSGNRGSAYIGMVAIDDGTYITTLDDRCAEGKKTFLVSVMLPDGRITLSDPLEYDFG